MGNAQDTFDKGIKHRLEGNEAFKKADLSLALKEYYMALLHLKNVGGQKEEAKLKAKARSELVMVYNNMCAVFAKQDKWDRVLFYASIANELDSTNTKTRFRLGQANLNTGNIELAKSLLEDVIKENPDDTSVKRELAKVAAANKSKDEKQNMIYRAMRTKIGQD